MMKRYGLPLLFVLVVLPTSAPARPPSDEEMLQAMMAGRSPLSPEDLDKAIATAERSPLGSKDNPVRVQQPAGQRAYLDTLRCADGKAPRYERRGNVGPGVYMSIIDLYVVDCGDAAPGRAEIHMDMYHPGHIERRPVPGFTIVGVGTSV